MGSQFVRLFFSRSICFSISILISLVFFSPLKAQVIEIELGNIKDLSERYSVQWQQFNNQFDYESYGERAQVTRLNPSISYDLEFLERDSQSEYEQFLYLQKEFRLPGHYRNLRERKDSRITQLEYETESSRAEWLAATRLGFIRILLNQREIEKLGILKDQIGRLSDASLRRAEAGETAALENQLMQMSRYHLEARIDEKQLETNRLVTLWKSRMGFDQNAEVRFTGNVNETMVNLPRAAELISILDNSPLARAERQAIQSASLGTATAQSSRLPSFELSAGYKQLNPNWHGFLVGIALPLPLLSSNREAISQARALEQIEQTEWKLGQMERNQITFQILNALDDYEAKLEHAPENLSQPDQFLDRLLISYREGALSLNDFLNSMSLMADAYQTKFSRLSGYYSMILELEAMTGQEFINP
jgi:hypothetical protein